MFLPRLLLRRGHSLQQRRAARDHSGVVVTLRTGRCHRLVLEFEQPGQDVVVLRHQLAQLRIHAVLGRLPERAFARLLDAVHIGLEHVQAVGQRLHAHVFDIAERVKSPRTSGSEVGHQRGDADQLRPQRNHRAVKLRVNDLRLD